MLNHHKKDHRRRWAGSALTCALILTSMALSDAGFAQTAANVVSPETQQREANTNRALLADLRERRAEVVKRAEQGADTREATQFLDEQIQKVQTRASEPDRQRVIIMENKEGAAPAIGERREIRVRRGPDGRTKVEGLDAELSARLERCEGEQGVLNVDEGDDKERTRILLCTKDGASPANRLQVLERVRERISGQADLSAETKQRLVAELERAIAAARGK